MAWGYRLENQISILDRRIGDRIGGGNHFFQPTIHYAMPVRIDWPWKWTLPSAKLYTSKQISLGEKKTGFKMASCAC